MTTRAFVLGLSTALLALVAPPKAAAPNWHITATVAESCSCTISCPCNFGGNPNRNPCEGNRIIAIKSGHYEDVDLAGVTFLVTFEMRSWSKIYVSDKVTDRFQRGMLSFTKAPITMEMTTSRVTFSGPESSVDMEVMKGFDGKPVKILNLPNPAYQDYTQFKSVSHTHKSADHSWTHSGTNGFTSTMDVGSK
jgi:hypothetical protein